MMFEHDKLAPEGDAGLTVTMYSLEASGRDISEVLARPTSLDVQ